MLRPAMSSSIRTALRGTATSVLLGLNTLIVAILLVPPALAKLLLRFAAVRRPCDRIMNALASAWVAVNNAWIAASNREPWDVQGVEGLHPKSWYLVSSNHRSWVDILVLQRVFHGRIPFLKFFLKQELIWVPVIGLAWWALDFPFMKRGRGSGAKANDLATTREACRKFKLIPTTVINFVEARASRPASTTRRRAPTETCSSPRSVASAPRSRRWASSSRPCSTSPSSIRAARRLSGSC